MTWNIHGSFNENDRIHALPEIIAIAAVGIGFAGVIRRATSRQDADRQAFQLAMDDLHKEIERLAGRQSHVEGALKTSRRTAAAE